MQLVTQTIRRFSSVLIVTGMILAPFFNISTAHATTTNAQLIPLYEYSGLSTFAGDWYNACSTARAGSFIIEDRTVQGAVNPSIDGAPNTALTNDGYTADANLSTAMGDCYDQGSAEGVLGYVNTWDYGTSSYLPWQNTSDPYDPATVKGQINLWYALYPGKVAGIFLDQVQTPDTTTNKSYYRNVAAYVHNNKSPNNEVVFNFGTDYGTTDWSLSSSTSADNSDIDVVFEGCYTGCASGDNLTTWASGGTWSPQWESNYPSNYFAALVYDTTSSDIANACSTLTSAPSGSGTNFYVTDANLPNPWATFISTGYQSSELSSC
ncbi:MAG TPA: spherulation-specific family 4 protein [Patescibacteria group bacterium]|nr:spherulation-specific family 4 protein [Patescibacteria group bacterium]